MVTKFVSAFGTPTCFSKATKSLIAVCPIHSGSLPILSESRMRTAPGFG